MNIRDHRTHFPPEDVEIFGFIGTYIRLLPDRLDLGAQNDEEDRLLYGTAYYEMLIFSLALEFGIKIHKVYIGGWTWSVYALSLPNKSSFVVSIPNAWMLGPMLLRDSQEEHIFSVRCDEDLHDKPDWFQRGVHTFREALHARMRALEESSAQATLGEPIQPI